MDTDRKLADLKRRLANARKRARYWAGLPSFAIGSGHSMSRLAQQRLAARGSDHEMEYEMALADCESLASVIEELSGSKPEVIDYKTVFNNGFNAAFCSRFGKAAS